MSCQVVVIGCNVVVAWFSSLQLSLDLELREF
jgi:hypothetical protein